MARELGVSTPTVFAAFSIALLASGAVGPWAGRQIDRRGGRPVLMTTSIVFALGLTALGMVDGVVGLFMAWLIVGLGMGAGLYEAAFASLVRLYGLNSRRAITGVTLIAGFASTVGWPLSAWLEVEVGWRMTCFIWAALHLTVGMILNASLPRAIEQASVPLGTTTSEAAPDNHEAAERGQIGAVYLLSFAFAAIWFVSTAMAAHLPSVLQSGGATLATAVFVGALVGPAQVAARLLEYGLLRRWHPVYSARLASVLHPLGAAAFAIFGPAAAPLFGVLHGAGNGIFTIAKGTLPLVYFGARGYGRQLGMLMLPSRIAQALAPWVFGLFIEHWGLAVLWLSAGLCMATCAALFALRINPRWREELSW